MRKTLTAIMLAMTLPTLAMAMPEGGPRHGGDDHDGHGSRMLKALDLNQEQEGEIRKLMGEQMKVAMPSLSVTWKNSRPPNRKPCRTN